MLKIYDKNKVFKGLINDYKSLCVDTTIETGRKSLSFELPLNERYIALIEEEMYIETKDYEYVIKEVNQDNNDFIRVYCSANIEDIVGNVIPIFDGFELTVAKLVEKCLVGTGWTYEVATDVSKRVITYQLLRTSSIDMLEKIKTEYNLEYYFNTKSKRLYVFNKMGSNKGAYFSNELKLKLLKKQTESYDYATRLIPIGKDGLTIDEVNNGQSFLENFQYSTKIITKYWIQEQYEVAELLKADAESYLENISMPRRAYRVDLSSFGKELELGDEITLVDNIKKIKEKQRVVRIIEYPQTPEKNKIELSNLMVNYVDEVRIKNSIIEKQIAYISKNLKDLTDIVINK